MAEQMKRCRVCGREYKPCRSPMLSPKVFRWQDVACSPECGAVYLERIMESRGKAAKKPEPVAAPKPEAKTETAKEPVKRGKKQSVAVVEERAVLESDTDTANENRGRSEEPSV